MYSQLGQDIWILETFHYKQGGIFVDIGAYDGIKYSNTLLLEKDYQWSGLLVEPGIIGDNLFKNRKSPIDRRCVYNQSGLIIDFAETNDSLLSGILSGFQQDEHAQSRLNNTIRHISTVTLTELCQTYNLPSYIDYISIDTEGTELDILKAHDFNRYKFGAITIEHNRVSKYKEDIRVFLESVGYTIDTSARFQWLSKQSSLNFEDWYICKK